MVVFVQRGDVVVDVFLRFAVHTMQTVMHDDGHFVSIGRIVGNTVRDGQRLNMAVAVFVLQAFAVQRGAPGGSADQEAARLLIAGRPAQVADTLETEHRVVDIERDHRQIVGAVRGCRRQPG